MVRTQQTGPVLSVVLSRPEALNALTPGMLRELAAVVEAAGQSSEVRVIVVSGDGDRAFSAGYDIASIPEGGAEFEPEALLDGAADALQQCPRPIIAKIRGLCMGGGCDVALACDVRIAADSTAFAIPAARIGAVYPPAGVRRFLSTIGKAGVQELLLTGGRIGAARARELDIVHRVVPSGELDGEVSRLAGELADNAPLSMAATKLLLRELAGEPRPGADARVSAMLEAVRSSADAREGKRAFLEKRRPRFTGA